MKLKLTALFLLFTVTVTAQDIRFAKRMVRKLSSRHFWGRGYTKDGVHKAENFLIRKFKNFGVAPMYGDSYEQTFSYPVNTFPGKMDVSINGNKLIPGRDFIVSADSRGVKCEGNLIQKDSTHFIDVQDRIIVTLENKLTFSAEQKVLDYTVIELDKNRQKSLPVAVRADIENVFINSFSTANICGMVKGTEKPDSILVYTAHYDHLGGMGDKTYFPGANDNASGVTEVLTLAKYYVAHPQPYSIAFILFSGEEAGLVGSKYFSENPLIPLKNIRFLVNLDLEGTGIDGITVVNATQYPNEFSLLRRVNDKGNFLVKVNARGKAANSDHYFFSENGVPSFYLYTLGGIKAYHDIYDRSATLPLTEYKNLFKLLVNFNAGLMEKKVE